MGHSHRVSPSVGLPGRKKAIGASMRPDLIGEPVVLPGLHVDMDVFHVLSEPAKCRGHHVIEEILRPAEPHGGLARRRANRERGFVIQRDDTPGIGDESLARFGRHEAAIFAP